MTERAILVTGIGGQGVQLATQVLARACVDAGREVQLFGSYGGMMRGGNTDATLVVADHPIEAPPTVGRAWAGIVMHGEFAAPVLDRIDPHGVVLTNSSIVSPHELDALAGVASVLELPVTDVAIDLGAIVTASMVMLGAFVAATGLVARDNLVEALPAAIPAYRSKHIETNRAAIDAGVALVPELVVPAWGEQEVLPA